MAPMTGAESGAQEAPDKAAAGGAEGGTEAGAEGVPAGVPELKEPVVVQQVVPAPQIDMEEMKEVGQHVISTTFGMCTSLM